MLLGGYVFAVETSVTSAAKQRRIFDITNSFTVDRIYIKCYMRYYLQRSVFCVFYVHIKEVNKIKNKITTTRQSYLSGLNPVIIEFESSLVIFFIISLSKLP